MAVGTVAVGIRRLDEREPGSRVVEVAFETDDELGLGEAAIGEVAFHKRGVEAEVGRSEQANRAGALKVAVELKQFGRRQRRVVVVHLRSSLCSWPTPQRRRRG
jgi:hypothetical protein